MRKNAIRLSGDYRATIENNFQFDYRATMAKATILRLLSDYVATMEE